MNNKCLPHLACPCRAPAVFRNDLSDPNLRHPITTITVLITEENCMKATSSLLDSNSQYCIAEIQSPKEDVIQENAKLALSDDSFPIFENSNVDHCIIIYYPSARHFIEKLYFGKQCIISQSYQLSCFVLFCLFSPSTIAFFLIFIFQLQWTTLQNFFNRTCVYMCACTHTTI